jgi:hypothetical protein
MRPALAQILAFLAGSGCVLAQGSAPRTRVQELSRQATFPNLQPLGSSGPSISTDRAQDSATSVASSEFGEPAILRRRAHAEPFRLSLDAQGYFTDNVALTPDHRQQDWYLRTGATLSYTNRVYGNWFADITLQYYRFRYEAFDILDFDLTRAEAKVLRQVPALANAFLYTRFAYERITEADFGSSLFSNSSIECGIEKTWRIARGQQIFGSVSADFSLDADPEFAARHEYAAMLGYSIRLTSRVNAAFSYHSSRYQYAHADRDDWTQLLAAGVTWDLAAWLRLGANITYTHNSSSVPATSYQSLVPGATLAVQGVF